MKIHNFHQHRTNISTLYLFFLKVFYIEVSKLVLFWFQSQPQKTTADFKFFLVILLFTGMFSYRWLDFQPVVQNQNWLLPIVLKVENALKLLFGHIYAIRTTQKYSGGALEQKLGNYTFFWYDFIPVVGFPTRGSKL